MNFRKIALTLAAAAALSPSISNASPEKDALNACARAFASSLSVAGAPSPTYKVAYRGNEFGGSILETYPHEYTFELHGHNPKTGAVVARASCSTDIHGVVTALASEPVEVKATTFAAQF